MIRLQGCFLPITVLLLASCTVDHSREASAANEQGMLHFRNGRAAEAKLAFIKAAGYANVSDSARTIYLENIANCYFRTERKDSAKYYYRKAAALHRPGSYHYELYNGYVHLLDGKTDSAISRFQKAWLRDRSGPSANNMLGQIYLGGFGEDYLDPVRAIEYTRKSYTLYSDLTTLFNLAKNEYMLNNVPRSERMFAELCKLDPGETNYLATLIMIKQELGKEKEAAKLLLRLKEADPEQYEQQVANPIEPGTHLLTWTE